MRIGYIKRGDDVDEEVTDIISIEVTPAEFMDFVNGMQAAYVNRVPSWADEQGWALRPLREFITTSGFEERHSYLL